VTAQKKSENSHRFKPTKSAISKVLYGETAGKKIYQYTLKNNRGMVVKVINYGAAITDVVVPDKNGQFESVVIGFDSLKSYTGRENSLFGSTVGRVANRISNAKFQLDGKEYKLTSNIHGGIKGFDRKVWDIEGVNKGKNVAVKLSYLSKDGEEGFPGNLNLTITYTLTQNNELKIDYLATTDKATPVVLTNHSYFNLSGGKSLKALNTELAIFADQYLEWGNGNIPTGKILDVKGTPYDFTQSQTIGKHITELKDGNGGYDLTYVLRNKTSGLALAAKAYEPLSGRVMEVFTTEPGVVFYTGNYMSSDVLGRGGKPLTKQGAFCLETQHFPDSPNQPTFPNCVLRPGETLKSQTVYKFSVRQ
jgi:aldose 1-epimerase